MYKKYVCAQFTYFNIFGRLRHNLLKLLGINTLDSCIEIA